MTTGGESAKIAYDRLYEMVKTGSYPGMDWDKIFKIFNIFPIPAVAVAQAVQSGNDFIKAEVDL